WYESVVPNLTLRVLLASLIFTGLQIYSHLRIENLLSDGLPLLITSGIVWVGGFWAIMQFATSHALGLGLAGMLILTCLSGMVSDGIQGLDRSPRVNTNAPAKKSIRMPRYNSPISPNQLKPGQGSMPSTPKTGPKASS
ncbi:MAG: hypothetical protein RJA81_2266, partial [Planctomycetota bacterium]